MTLLASLAVGVVAYLAVGLLTGYLPRVRTRVSPPRRARIERQVWLLQAGTELTAAQFVAGSLAAGTVTFALVALVTGSPVVAVVPGAAVGFAPHAFFGHRRVQRLSELQQAWPDGIRHVIGGIQSGMSLNQSIATDRVIEILLLAHERGGRIVTDVLRDLADATSRDLKTMEEIASDRLEPKINSRAVFALPWFVLVMLCATPGPIRDFYKTAAGVVVIVIAAVISLAGIMIVERLSRDPAEERVFASPTVPR